MRRHRDRAPVLPDEQCWAAGSPGCWSPHQRRWPSGRHQAAVQGDKLLKKLLLKANRHMGVFPPWTVQKAAL